MSKYDLYIHFNQKEKQDNMQCNVAEKMVALLQRHPPSLPSKSPGMKRGVVLLGRLDTNLVFFRLIKDLLDICGSLMCRTYTF